MEKIKITKVKLKGDDGFKTFSVRLPNELYNELTKIADKTNRSRNEIITILLKAATENVEIDNKE